MATGIPAFFATFADLKRAYPPAVLQDHMAAWVFLPLTASGRTLGSMVLAYDQPRPFTAEERAILTSIAGLVAQALERARLYDAQYQLAHSLQAALLPHALPPVPGLDLAARYLPATHGVDIGGDFYDLIRLDETNATAAIGDVQGLHPADRKSAASSRLAGTEMRAVGRPPRLRPRVRGGARR
ncbi:GAF domain-containing protein [Streptomyces sp. NPDC096354]|uniref:GAF domain-containing protein n=1 Tax=Streptomyces sp. NPDC096354 TaxID=3366088 RepID=UPI0037F7D235